MTPNAVTPVSQLSQATPARQANPQPQSQQPFVSRVKELWRGQEPAEQPSCWRGSVERSVDTWLACGRLRPAGQAHQNVPHDQRCPASALPVVVVDRVNLDQLETGNLG